MPESAAFFRQALTVEKASSLVGLIEDFTFKIVLISMNNKDHNIFLWFI